MDSWSKTLNKFKNKQIDLIDVISYKKNREVFTNFSKPYFEIPSVVFARKGEFDNYTGFNSLKGKKVAITKGTYYHDDINSLQLFELIEFTNAEDKMKALAYGKVDAIFHNLITAQRAIKSAGYAHIKILDELDSSIVKKEDLRIGVNKENNVLFSIINKSIEAITREEKEALSNKWFAAKIEKKTSTHNIYLTDEETQYLQEKKQITMCIDPDAMPFEKLDNNGNHIGMTAEYYQIFRHNLNTNIKVIKTRSWNDSLKSVRSRICDILSLAAQTPNRKKYLDFTTPYLNIPIVIATKLDVSFIDNIKSIKNKSVGITKGYPYIELVKNKYPNLNIVEVKSIEDGLIKVNEGELFGYIGTLSTISYQFQRESLNNLKIAGRFDENSALGIGVRNDDKVLLNILEKVVRSIDIKQHQQILNNWISIKYEKGIDSSLIWKIAMAVTLLILLFMYRQYSLKKANENLQIAVENKTKDLLKLNETLAIKIKEEVEKNLQIQEKLFKSEKMASMGEMIGNIAHQWRQPLSVISTGITGIEIQKRLNCLPDDVFYTTCDTINTNAQYLSKTIDDFRNFIKGERILVIYDLKECMESFIELITPTSKNHNLTLILNFEEDINLNGYPNELTQCLINIFNNAKDVLLNLEEEDKLLFISASKNKDSVTIDIRDSGGGIAEDIFLKIFDPYFTTKHKSKGTGLGLHMAYNIIVDGMKGSITASNVIFTHNDKEYLGANFNIIVPNNL
jgi:ABC-type amino acid transport substrate-binding protein/nitrogen-specific signal transduction histidine kinase